MNKKEVKKICGVILEILLYLFLAICVFAVVLTIAAKKDSDGAAEIFGYQMRIISSDSMAKCDATDVSGYDIKSLPLRSMVFIKLAPRGDEAAAREWYSKLRVGDVLTFRYVYTQQVTITHRITSISPKDDGGYIIELRGDNKASDSELMSQVIDTSDTSSPNYVIGKVSASSLALGAVLSLLRTPIGIIFIVIIPCLILILLEIIKIVGLVGAERRKREREESEKRESELCELRQRLMELEGKSAEPELFAAREPTERGEEGSI